MFDPPGIPETISSGCRISQHEENVGTENPDKTKFKFLLLFPFILLLFPFILLLIQPLHLVQLLHLFLTFS